MKAIRNLIRAPIRSMVFVGIYSLLTFILVLVFVINALAQIQIKSAVGPLGNSVKVSSSTNESRITVNQAQYISDNFDVVVNYHAQSSCLCSLPNIEHFNVEAQEDPFKLYDPFTLLAVTSTDTVKEFYSGNRVIIAGTGITREDNDNGLLKILVSDELAKLNALSIGDPIQLQIKTIYSKDTYELTVYVGGFFEDTITIAPNAVYNYQLADNEIYIPLSVYEYLLRNSTNQIVPQKMYFELANTSRSTVTALELRLRNVQYQNTKDLKLSLFSPDTEAYAMIKLTKTLYIVITIVLVCFLSTLLGVLFWNMNSRSDEIAIYCALGSKRKSICRMFTRENLLLFFTAFIIVILMAFIFIGAFADSLLPVLSPEKATIQYETSIETVLSNEAILSNNRKLLSNAEYLTTHFLLPAFLKALLCCLSTILAVHLVSWVALCKINVVTILKGRAQ